MKFCQQHWDDLRQAIDQRGMSRFVSHGGGQAMQRTLDELSGVNDPTQPYDPLMAAHWAIVNRVMDSVGLYLMGGDKCPLCVVNENCADCKCGKPQEAHAQEWIDGCTDFFQREFKNKGWLKDATIQ